MGIPISSETPEPSQAPQPSLAAKASPGGTATSFADTRPPQLGAKHKTAILAAASGAAAVVLLFVVIQALRPAPESPLGRDTRPVESSLSPSREVAREAPAALLPTPVTAPEPTPAAPLPSAPPSAKAATSGASRLAPRPKPGPTAAPPPEDNPLLQRK